MTRNAGTSQDRSTIPADLNEQFSLRQVQTSARFPFTQIGLAIGTGNLALEVLFCQTVTALIDTDLHAAWKERQAGRATPILIVAFHGQHASLCGPTGPDPPTQRCIDPGHTIRLCREALGQSDRHAAIRFLGDTLPTIETALPGLRNEGLFANHELAKGARLENELWTAADAKARPLLGQQGEALLHSLGLRLDSDPPRVDAISNFSCPARAEVSSSFVSHRAARRANYPNRNASNALVRQAAGSTT